MILQCSNFDLSGTSRRCLRGSFRPPFSKGGADPTRGALVASAEATQTTAFSFAKLFFCANGNKRKADVEHKKGIRRKRNPVLLIVTVCPLFSLTPEAQRKKLSKKEMPLSLRRCSVSHYTALREISPLRRRPIPHRRSSGLSFYALRFRALDGRRLLRKIANTLCVICSSFLRKLCGRKLP